MRGHEESKKLDIGYRGSDGGFLVNSYGGLLQEADLTTSKVFGHMFDMTCANTPDDIRLFNVCHLRNALMPASVCHVTM